MRKTQTRLTAAGRMLISIVFADYEVFKAEYSGGIYVVRFAKKEEGTVYFAKDIKHEEFLSLATLSLRFWEIRKDNQGLKHHYAKQLYKNAERILDTIEKENNLESYKPYDSSWLAETLAEQQFQFDGYDLENEQTQAMIKAGIREIDIQLYNAAWGRRYKETKRLLKEGANPFVNFDDSEGVYMGSIFAQLVNERPDGAINPFFKMVDEYYAYRKPVRHENDPPDLSEKVILARAKELYSPGNGGVNLYGEENWQHLLARFYQAITSDIFHRLLRKESQYAIPTEPVLPPFTPPCSQAYFSFHKPKEELPPNLPDSKTL